MVIDFKKIEAKEEKAFKGGEKQVYIKTAVSDGKVKIMEITIPKGATIGLHTHTSNSEEIFLIKGKGHFLTDGKKEEVKAGLAYYCPQGSTHTFVNEEDGDTVFFAVVPEAGV